MKQIQPEPSQRNADNEWLSTRNKRKIVQNDIRPRKRCCVGRPISKQSSMTHNAQPLLLKLATKQSDLLTFFQSTGSKNNNGVQRIISERESIADHCDQPDVKCPKGHTVKDTMVTVKTNSPRMCESETCDATPLQSKKTLVLEKIEAEKLVPVNLYCANPTFNKKHHSFIGDKKPLKEDLTAEKITNDCGENRSEDILKEDFSLFTDIQNNEENNVDTLDLDFNSEDFAYIPVKNRTKSCIQLSANYALQLSSQHDLTFEESDVQHDMMYLPNVRKQSSSESDSEFTLSTQSI